MAVFAERGFHDVTVEQVAHAIGISRATFFRHLGSKEEAVIFAVEYASADYAAILRALPDDDVRGWALMRATVEPTVRRVELDPARQRSRLEVIDAEPSLRAKLAETRIGKVDRLGEALTERIGDPLTARVLAVAGMAAFDAAWSEWMRDPDADFRMTVDAVFARLRAMEPHPQPA